MNAITITATGPAGATRLPAGLTGLGRVGAIFPNIPGVQEYADGWQLDSRQKAEWDAVTIPAWTQYAADVEAHRRAHGAWVDERHGLTDLHGQVGDSRPKATLPGDRRAEAGEMFEAWKNWARRARGPLAELYGETVSDRVCDWVLDGKASTTAVHAAFGRSRQPVTRWLDGLLRPARGGGMYAPWRLSLRGFVPGGGRGHGGGHIVTAVTLAVSDGYPPEPARPTLADIIG